MPKYYQFFRVHVTWTAPIIHEVMKDYLQKKRKSLFVPKNKLMSIKNGVRPGTHRVSVSNNVLTHLQQ